MIITAAAFVYLFALTLPTLAVIYCMGTLVLDLFRETP